MDSDPSATPHPRDPHLHQPAPDLGHKARRILLGPPRDLNDRSLFHRISLIPLLAWIGLGSDGLSSSCYGPEEAFRMLGPHTWLALALALATTATVCVIAIAYSRVIEHFPSGGGGYVVAYKILGEKAGVVSGSALLVDYVLTIAMSVAAAGDALLSLLPPEWQHWKVTLEAGVIVFLIILNLRGIKESILTLTPVFILFVVSHVAVIVYGIWAGAPRTGAVIEQARQGLSGGAGALGIVGIIALLTHAYSMGGGTYTGIEAVSNGLPIMREPKVATGKRTMLYMAASLSFTASGLLLCYMLWGLAPVEGKTMNALLAERLLSGIPLGQLCIVLTLVSEGALLVVAAQTGFVDGPRVLANMAMDSWAPRRFATLSERLTMQNGITIMGLAALAVLLYTAGDVRHLVVLYSINVFLTFSLTETSMCKFWVGERKNRRDWARKISIHVIGLAMCLTILVVIVKEKFMAGGWITLAVTGALIALAFLIRRHYRSTGKKLVEMFRELEQEVMAQEPPAAIPPLDPQKPTAVVLVASYSGIGIHTIMNAFRLIPNHFHNLVFISVGVIDSGGFKGETAIDALRAQTEESLARYREVAARLGIPSTSRYAIGTDALDEAEKLCLAVKAEFPHVTFFAGKIIFTRQRWYDRILHNETALSLQKRLQLHEEPMVIVPAVV
jgi:amino acid transporter